MNENEKLTTIGEGSDKGILLGPSLLTSKKPTHTQKNKAVAYLDTSCGKTFMTEVFGDDNSNLSEEESNSSFGSNDDNNNK